MQASAVDIGSTTVSVQSSGMNVYVNGDVLGLSAVSRAPAELPFKASKTIETRTEKAKAGCIVLDENQLAEVEGR